VIELSETNILIGQNNSGKTSFMEAINYALNSGKNDFSEDDFFADTEDFNPILSEPIKVVLEFRESAENTFSDNYFYLFDKNIQYDVASDSKNPVPYVRLCCEFYYDPDKGRYVDERYFVDSNSDKLPSNSTVRKEHLNFSPSIYLTTLRDISKEINSKYSYWSKLKKSIDCKDKETEIQKQIETMNDLILKDNSSVDDLLTHFESFKNDVILSSDSLELKVFSKRNWELLDGLNIYLKKSGCNLLLPISKHGMGSQSLAVFFIFNAYLDLILPQIAGNDEATPIICIEEPEAHIHPHAQRSIFSQISKMSGQKLISTHSPFVADQVSIYDYILFKNKNGVSDLKRIPKYRKGFIFRNGLPPEAFETNKFLKEDEELLIKRYVQLRNSELFFSSIFILCEGDTERTLLEHFFSYLKKKTPSQFGISIITCDGQVYSPFLKLASADAFELDWYILSDAEDETKKMLKSTIKDNGFDYENALKSRIHFLPDKQDIESYYIDFYGTKILNDFISEKYGHKSVSICKSEIEKEIKEDKFEGIKSIDDLSEKEILNIFIDRKGKVKFAEAFALYVIKQKLKVPKILEKLIDKTVEVTLDGQNT
jgi:putative ATP-dependent endonuclease of OLD family